MNIILFLVLIGIIIYSLHWDAKTLDQARKENEKIVRKDYD